MPYKKKSGNLLKEPRIYKHVILKAAGCLLENNIKANTYIGHTTTTLSPQIMYHLSNINVIK